MPRPLLLRLTQVTVVARGRELFSVNCSFCHGADARGGEGGPNLMRSQIVLDDQHGEIIFPVVQSGRPDKGMPNFTLSAGDVSDIATYLHSLNVPRGGNASAPLNILVGDAKAGQAYFNGAGKCNTCHSVTGDLAGIGSKLESKALQNALVAAAELEADGARLRLLLRRKREGHAALRDRLSKARWIASIISMFL